MELVDVHSLRVLYFLSGIFMVSYSLIDVLFCLQILVLDEADRVLDSAFKGQLDRSK